MSVVLRLHPSTPHPPPHPPSRPSLTPHALLQVQSPYRRNTKKNHLWGGPGCVLSSSWPCRFCTEPWGHKTQEVKRRDGTRKIRTGTASPRLPLKASARIGSTSRPTHRGHLL